MRYGVIINPQDGLIYINYPEWLKYKQFYVNLFTRISSFLHSISSYRYAEAKAVLKFVLGKDITS